MQSKEIESMPTGAEKPDSLSRAIWVDMDSMASRSIAPGVTIYPVAGQNIMMNFVRVDPGAVIPDHHHSHEQAGTVLDGMLFLTIDGETRELHSGQGYIALSHVPHSARGGPNGCLVLDIFSPPRAEYLLNPE